MNPVIQVDGPGRNFGATRALAGVDLAVRRGRVLCRLGPNGSSKTTTVRVLATLLRRDFGGHACSATVVAEPQAVRARIGLTGQYAAADEACPWHLPPADVNRDRSVTGRWCQQGLPASNCRRECAP